MKRAPKGLFEAIRDEAAEQIEYFQENREQLRRRRLNRETVLIYLDAISTRAYLHAKREL